MTTYQWEIVFMQEIDSVYVTTLEDSVLDAAQTYYDNYGDHMKVYAIRKDAEIIRFEEAI